MNRQDKIAVVESLHSDFANSKAAFVVGYKGLTVKQLRDLRNQLRKEGGTLRVAKARLMKRAAQGLTGPEGLEPALKEQVAIVFAVQEASPVAKVLHTFSKENAGLSVVSGFMDSQILDSSTIIRIATLPSREVMLAMVCGTLKAPVQKMAGVLAALRDKLEAAAAASAQPVQEAQSESAAPEQAETQESEQKPTEENKSGE